jgi:hypothetical protein
MAGLSGEIAARRKIVWPKPISAVCKFDMKNPLRFIVLLGCSLSRGYPLFFDWLNHKSCAAKYPLLHHRLESLHLLNQSK